MPCLNKMRFLCILPCDDETNEYTCFGATTGSLQRYLENGNEQTGNRRRNMIIQINGVTRLYKLTDSRNYKISQIILINSFHKSNLNFTCIREMGSSSDNLAYRVRFNTNIVINYNVKLIIIEIFVYIIYIYNKYCYWR